MWTQLCLANQIDQVCSEISDLLHTKNKMYGDSFKKTLQEYGNIIICVRLDDKLNRLKQIILKGLDDSNTDEKMIDTLRDMAGYAILALASFIKDGTKNG